MSASEEVALHVSVLSLLMETDGEMVTVVTSGELFRTIFVCEPFADSPAGSVMVTIQDITSSGSTVV